MVVNKTDGKNDLTGADFALYKEVPAGTKGAQTGAAIKETLEGTIQANASALDNTKSYVVAGKKTGTIAGSTFEFKGIDDGHYVLVETTIPSGYNGFKSIEFDVTATHDDDNPDPQLLTLNGKSEIGEVTLAGDQKATVNPADGTITTTVANISGSSLPSTGGIGTTIFYVVGAILVLGAAIVLVSRRKNNAQ